MGSLFIPDFKRKPIDNDAYFTQLMVYIHNNPLHHKFVKNINDWPYSSWHAYLLQKTARINKEEGLDWFGGLEAFIKMHRVAEEDGINEP